MLDDRGELQGRVALQAVAGLLDARLWAGRPPEDAAAALGFTLR